MKKQARSFLSLLASAALCAALFPGITASAAVTLTENKTGTYDGYSYELWKDSGTTTMVVGEKGTYSCEWSNINNCLFRTGQKFDCTQTYEEMGNIQLDFECDYHPNGNSYLCVYGWSRDPLIEYYIVESWGNWRPPGADSLGKITVDGGTYDVYKTLREQQPSIDGTATFYQYWSVRTEDCKRTSGTITVSDHFKAWDAMGLNLGKLYEVALNVEGWQSQGTANVTKNELTIGGDPKPTEPATEPEPDADGYFFHSTYESGTDSWQGRGDAKVAASSAQAFAGSQSLAVTGRTDTWNGCAYPLSTAVFQPSKAYSFSAMAMAQTAEDFKLTLQYEDASGEEQYASVATASAGKGEWVQLANPSYTIPAGASSLLLYVETDGSTSPFFVDEAIGAPEGTEITVDLPAKEGDVNGDGEVSVLDIVALQKFLVRMDAQVSSEAADLDHNGRLDVIDLVMLKQLVLTPQIDPPLTEDPTEAPERVDGVFYNTADVSWIDKSKPMVALCFDDGPWGDSSGSAYRIQNALADNGFHATFFYWGNRINSGNEAEIARADSLGFEIANHTYTHPDLTTLDAAGIQSEIKQTADILTRITGKQDFLLRPPYLAVNDTVKANAGTPLITCAVDSGDWNNATTQEIINKVTAKMNDGSLNNNVVLMHETYDTTAEAMEYLAPYMKQQGWQIVTVSEMFKANGKDMYDGEVYAYVR